MRTLSISTTYKSVIRLNFIFVHLVPIYMVATWTKGNGGTITKFPSEIIILYTYIHTYVRMYVKS